MRAYLLILDETTPSRFGAAQFHQQLTTADGVLNWWHYIGNAYIILVNDHVNASDVSNYVLGVAPKRNHFVVHIDLRDHNGWLPKEAWDWINQHAGIAR